MSREILKLVQKIDSSTVDLQMVLQCAPVLAGLKVSNMLSVSRAFYPRILEVLMETDISCYLLRQTDEKVILLLYKEQELQKLKKKGYNFILIDYGEYLERDESYGDCGIQIIIAGAKPWEVEKTFYVFQDTAEEKLKKYHYFFNFVADDLKDEVRSGMDNLKSIHFLTYAEDPFNSEDFPDIEDIIYEYSKPEPVPDKKKRKGFKKKG